MVQLSKKLCLVEESFQIFACAKKLWSQAFYCHFNCLPTRLFAFEFAQLNCRTGHTVLVCGALSGCIAADGSSVKYDVNVYFVVNL